MSADTRKPQDCGCAYEFVEDGAVLRKRWFHEPGCALAAGVGVPPDEDSDECQRCGMPGHLCECDSGSAPAKERQDARARVLSDIAQERGLQDSKWGGSEHDDTHTSNNWTFWLDLIDEHTRKAFSTEGLYTAYPNARHRLIEVAALAAAAVESFDRAMGYDEPPAGVGEARPAEPPDDIRICLQPRHRELEDECGRLRERLADTETEKIERGTEILRLREQLDALAVQRDDLQRELRRAQATGDDRA